MTDDNEKFTKSGRAWRDIKHELVDRRQSSHDMAWDSLRNMKASYNAGDDVFRVAWEAYTLFNGDNMLYGGTLYPSLLSLADDVIDMTLDMLQAPPEAGGTMTTGGTESILLAVRAAFRWASEQRTFSGRPQIVAPYNVHPAFDKAAGLMGLEVLRVPLTGFRGDADAIAAVIGDDTFMIVGSAPAYPLGHVDPIAEFAGLARTHNLWLHVDSCVGGFFLPFAVALGNPVPSYDFAIPEVQSMSVDLHKYGYTARGASLILLRQREHSQYHVFDFHDWPTGAFITSTFAGSRPAGAVASAWAVMNYLGFDGYCDRVQKIIAARNSLVAAAESVSGIKSCGTPEGGIVGFQGCDDALDLFAVRDGMTARGWQTGVVMEPRGFQTLLNCRHGEIVDDFADDLRDVTQMVREGRISATNSDLSYGG